MMEGLGFRPYEAYKDSHASWLGEVPAHWQVGPGRICTYENKDKNTGMKESTVLSLSYGRVIVKDEDKMTGLVPESYETYQIVQPGDIIIRGTDLQNDVTSLRTGLAKDHGIITSAYINLRPKPNAYADFLHYLLHSYDVKKVFYGLGSGLRQNLSYVDFKYLTIPLPSLPEQRAIVAFLDDKCAKIEGAVKIKEDQIALLRERRQIIIQEAVTRGLNPAAPMKDSGIDWIGQIPAHWEVKRFKHFFSTAMGETILGENLIDDGKIPVYSATEGDHFFGYVNKSKVSLSAGDLVIPARGNSIGFPKLVAAPATCSQTTIYAKKLRGISSEFVFFYLLSCKRFLFQFIQTAIPQITVDEVKNNILLLPPPHEQVNLVEYCEDITLRFDGAIAIKRRQIDALNEYKTSLINAAVTGKIKVI
ncbi:MAG: restriction endonuclease subunit S [Limnobacter sp.]|uniref:restriction endonuclease subunit S n=1 Tax=Limnobacter sp. TaxID=2003368 RepID=UPI0022C9EE28|nr:restriction endonuclease subunit S [Limnobacter sp.]MCZ8015163.1 restriction endonuclease subunit S [Limnobacter sp.]